MLVTVFPLLLLLVTILGIILADDPADRTRVLNSALGEFPIIGQQLGHNIHALKRSTVFGLVFGILGLIYGSTRLAQTGLYSMEQIWNIPGVVRPNYVTRMARSVIFLVVLAIGLIVTTALAGLAPSGSTMSGSVRSETCWQQWSTLGSTSPPFGRSLPTGRHPFVDPWGDRRRHCLDDAPGSGRLCGRA